MAEDLQNHNDYRGARTAGNPDGNDQQGRRHPADPETHHRSISGLLPHRGVTEKTLQDNLSRGIDDRMGQATKEFHASTIGDSITPDADVQKLGIQMIKAMIAETIEEITSMESQRSM